MARPWGGPSGSLTATFSSHPLGEEQQAVTGTRLPWGPPFMTLFSPYLFPGPLFLTPSHEGLGVTEATHAVCGWGSRQRKLGLPPAKLGGLGLLPAVEPSEGASGACAVRGPVAICLLPLPTLELVTLASWASLLCAFALMIIIASTYPSFPVQQVP